MGGRTCPHTWTHLDRDLLFLHTPASFSGLPPLSAVGLSSTDELNSPDSDCQSHSSCLRPQRVVPRLRPRSTDRDFLADALLCERPQPLWLRPAPTSGLPTPPLPTPKRRLSYRKVNFYCQKIRVLPSLETSLRWKLCDVHESWLSQPRLRPPPQKDTWEPVSGTHLRNIKTIK